MRHGDGEEKKADFDRKAHQAYNTHHHTFMTTAEYFSGKMS